MRQTLNRPSPGRRLAIICTVAAAAGAYVLYDRQQVRSQVQAREKLRVEQAAAADAALVKAMQKRQRADRARAAQAEAARRAAMTPGQLRRERIEQQFSGWDGSHHAVEQAIKARMNNPRSYVHERTTWVDRGIGHGITAHTTFRGTNAFNAVVRTVAVVELDESGDVTSVMIGR